MHRGECDTAEAIQKGGIPPLWPDNWPAETFHYALERFDFLQLLDGIVVSGIGKVKKPDPRFYQILLSRYGLKADECLFLDDREENLAAAQKLGFHVEHII